MEPLFAKSALKGRAPAGTHVPRPRPGTHRAAATPPAAHIDARCPVAPPTARATPFCGPFRRVSDLSPGLHCSKARGYFPGTMCLGSLDRGPNLTSRGIRAPTLEFRACGTVAVWVPKCSRIAVVQPFDVRWQLIFFTFSMRPHQTHVDRRVSSTFSKTTDAL